jgi:hypothetical protein
MTTVALPGGASLTLELYPVLNRKDSGRAAPPHETLNKNADFWERARRAVQNNHPRRAPLDRDRRGRHLQLQPRNDPVLAVSREGAWRAENYEVSWVVGGTPVAAGCRNSSNGPHLPCTIMRRIRQDEVPWRILFSWMSVFRQLFVRVVRGRNAVAELVGRGPDDHLLLLGGGCCFQEPGWSSIISFLLRSVIQV